MPLKTLCYVDASVLFSFRFASIVFEEYLKSGFDVKALRAFRVLRPLRLVSGVPSKLFFDFIYFIGADF